MRKSWSIRAAVLAALSLSFAWGAQAARSEPGKSEPGKIYRYTSSLGDGSGAGDQLLFVSGNRVEVLSTQKGNDNGLLLAFEMDGPGLAPKVLKAWELSPAERAFVGTIESLPAEKALRVEIFSSGRPAEKIAAPVFPWTMSDGLSALNLAFAALKDPQGSFTVGIVSPGGPPGGPPVHFAGTLKASYVGEE